MGNILHLLLWTDSPGPYIEAIQNAGLADRVTIDSVGRAAKPSAVQRSATHVLLAAAVPEGLLPTMADLRWVQSATAGVEVLGGAARSAFRTDLDLRAWCSPRVDAEEYPQGAFQITKPYTAIAMIRSIVCGEHVLQLH
jgi:hypothetical protein